MECYERADFHGLAEDANSILGTNASVRFRLDAFLAENVERVTAYIEPTQVTTGRGFTRLLSPAGTGSRRNAASHCEPRLSPRSGRGRRGSSLAVRRRRASANLSRSGRSVRADSDG